MIDNSQFRFFSFWFTTFANGGDMRSVKIEDRENYIFTYNSAKKNGPITEGEGFSLGRRIESIYKSEINTL